MAECLVDGCNAKRRSAEYCGCHYGRISTGRPLIRPCRGCNSGDVKTSSGYHVECKPTVCIWCESAPVVNRHPEFCSAACRHAHGTGIARFTNCDRCGDEIDLLGRSRTGRRKRIDTSICDPCRRARYTRHKTSVSVLAKLWGTKCNICDGEIDLNLKFPDEFCASVDHEIPYSRGGSHDPENLRLAHLWCNKVKHDRQGFKI